VNAAATSSRSQAGSGEVLGRRSREFVGPRPVEAPEKEEADDSRRRLSGNGLGELGGGVRGGPEFLRADLLSHAMS
jgi:hypothetical protein